MDLPRLEAQKPPNAHDRIVAFSPGRPTPHRRLTPRCQMVHLLPSKPRGVTYLFKALLCFGEVFRIFIWMPAHSKTAIGPAHIFLRGCRGETQHSVEISAMTLTLRHWLVGLRGGVLLCYVLSKFHNNTCCMRRSGRRQVLKLANSAGNQARNQEDFLCGWVGFLLFLESNQIRSRVVPAEGEN